eukprot:scaffold5569_cov116-Isochrysis_galbana.AAC.1
MRNESYATGGTPHCGSFPPEESAISFLCEIAATEFHLPPSHPRVQGYACTKIYRAAGESRVNAARLALEDLARFEGSDPQLSLFRRRLDGVFTSAL